KGRSAKNCEAVHVSSDWFGMRGYHRYGSCRDRCAARRIDSARSGAWLDGGGSAGIDRRPIDRAAANSGDEFRLILGGGLNEPGDSRKIRGSAREAGVRTATHAEHCRKPAGATGVATLRRETRAPRL